MTKRFLALFLSLLLLLLMTACGSKPQAAGDAPPVDAGPQSQQEEDLLYPEPLPPAPPPSSESFTGGDEGGTEAVQPETPAATSPGSAGFPEANSPDPAPAGEGGVSEGRVLDPSKPMVALTFDDGPHAAYTDQLLDILEENGAVATFFEVARNLSQDPDAVRRAEALGCEIGSHSYRHADLGKMSEASILEDIDKANAQFEAVLGHAPTLLRPPYGSLSKTLKSCTTQSLITWSIDTEDWLNRDTEKIIASVKNFGDLNGHVILMHSTYDTTVAACRELIPWLIDQGYQLATITELITLHYGDEVVSNGLYGYSYFYYGKPAIIPPSPPKEDTPSDGTSNAGEGTADTPPVSEETGSGSPDAPSSETGGNAEGSPPEESAPPAEGDEKPPVEGSEPSPPSEAGAGVPAEDTAKSDGAAEEGTPPPPAAP